jgi:hypothetical protein
MSIRKKRNDGKAISVKLLIIIFMLIPTSFLIPAQTSATPYHTIAVIDNAGRLSTTDSALTYALDTVISYRIETLPDTSLVPSFDLDMYLQESDVESLWAMDKSAAKKFGRTSNADLIIIGRHTLPSPGSVSVEFHVIYLALDDSVRTSRITFKVSTADIAGLQKIVFEKLLDKLPVSVPPGFWKKQNTIKSKKAFDWFGEGLRSIADRRDETGLALFEKSLGAEPDSRDIHYYIGCYYAKRQYNYERAFFHLNAVLKRNPGDAGAHYWLGFTYYLKADYPSAVKEFEKVKSIEPESVETLFLLGILYEENGNYSAAANRYREALKLVPQRASIWYSLAAALAVIGRPDEAVAALQRTLELDRKGFYNMSRTDADFASIRKTPAFQKLMESFKQ